MRSPGDAHSELVRATAIIASGAALSNAIDLGGMHLIGLIMPAAWTAAGITLQASLDDGQSFANVFDASGNEVALTVDASRWVRLAPDDFAGFNVFRLRSGTVALPVNQAAERQITVVGRLWH